MPVKKIYRKIEDILKWLDNSKLWVIGLIIATIVFVPYIYMGESSVFPWHDQLDENILHYVLTARHLGENINRIPEMMSGVNVSAITPYGVLFVLLYVVFTPFVAFVIQYLIVFAIAFGGMYALIKYQTDSSIIAFICAGLYSLLPYFPVYGSSVAAIPMMLFAVILLEKKENMVVAYVLIAIYVTTSSLFFTGYSILFFWCIRNVYLIVNKKINRYTIIGFVGVALGFIVINYRLVLEFLVTAYKFSSSRDEYVSSASSFTDTLFYSFINGGYDADSLAKYIVIPIIVILIIGCVFYRRLVDKCKKTLSMAICIMMLIVVCSFLSATFSSEVYVGFKNNTKGFLHSFQIDRFFWLLPGLWWTELGLTIAIFWSNKDVSENRLWKLAIVLVILIPSMRLVKENSYLYMSVNQINNGTQITGYIPWKSYYAEDVMSNIENAIGKDMTSYRVAHIGINPTPALMHGFYTVDGYANSYELEYKHKFREIISGEIDSSPDTAAYFDNWGSRCYLFNSQSGTAYMIGKDTDVKYEGLQYNWDLLRDMDVEYLFSAGEILDSDAIGIVDMGYFTSENSYWGIYLYKL